MKSLIIASNNEHKIKEIKEILSDNGLDILSLKDAGINIDVEEDGETFSENAYKKANEIKNYLLSIGKNNFMVMADDSGLEVDYLNGEPGVYSARYAGEHGNDRRNNEKLLSKLQGVPFEKRTASFVCAISLITSEGVEILSEGRTNGIITEGFCGEESFGYDPLFYVKEKGLTFAQMSSDEKNLLSHRGKALDVLKSKLNDLL